MIYMPETFIKNMCFFMGGKRIDKLKTFYDFYDTSKLSMHFHPDYFKLIAGIIIFLGICSKKLLFQYYDTAFQNLFNDFF